MEANFPYVKKRLKVIEKQEVQMRAVSVTIQIELSPIETNIETIKKMSLRMKTEISTKPPNIKSLQMALQGSLLLRTEHPRFILIFFRGECWPIGAL